MQATDKERVNRTGFGFSKAKPMYVVLEERTVLVRVKDKPAEQRKFFIPVAKAKVEALAQRMADKMYDPRRRVRGIVRRYYETTMYDALKVPELTVIPPISKRQLKLKRIRDEQAKDAAFQAAVEETNQRLAIDIVPNGIVEALAG